MKRWIMDDNELNTKKSPSIIVKLFIPIQDGDGIIAFSDSQELYFQEAFVRWFKYLEKLGLS